MFASALLSPLLLITLVAGHGLIKVPNARLIGPAMLASCGAGPYNVENSDPYGPIENAYAKIGTGYTSSCDLWGLKYEDNKSRVYTYAPGQIVNMQTDIEAHHPGYCNVSVLSTTTKKIISGPLIEWPEWGNTGYPWPESESNFNVTIPNLGSKCVTPGACVLQWYWYSPRGNPLFPKGNNQTYESCIDFIQPV